MAIVDFLPIFKHVELNQSYGLRMGHIIAQSPVNKSDIVSVQKGNKYFIENGILMGLEADGRLHTWDKGAVIIHYDDPLNEFLDEDKYYAIPVADTGDTYVRGIVLYVGDVFTTNNYGGTFDAATTKYAKIANGLPTLQTEIDNDTKFAVAKATLPNGDAAIELTYLG